MDSEDVQKELESEEYKKEWSRHNKIFNDFLHFITYSVISYKRVSEINNNFFIAIFDDIVQSAVAISILARDGIRNTCRRELRYLIELGIKACYIAQKYHDNTFEKQIQQYEGILKSPSISPINQLNLHFLKPYNREEEYKIQVKREYGLMSVYVHSAPQQIYERLGLSKVGRYIGQEGTKELTQLNDEMGLIYSYILVLLFHSLPSWIVGDFLVNMDGTTFDWYFAKSKYVALVDECFDYKHERQDKLDDIRIARAKSVCF